MSSIKGKGTRKFILKMSLGYTILKRHYDVQQLGCTWMERYFEKTNSTHREEIIYDFTQIYYPPNDGFKLIRYVVSSNMAPPRVVLNYWGNRNRFVLI